MATSTESNPPRGKDLEGLLEPERVEPREVDPPARAGHAGEIEACKAHRAKLAAKDETKGLLEIMVEAKVLTKNQSVRLLKEIVGETQPQARDPRLPDPREARQGLDGDRLQGAADRASTAIVAVKILLDALAQNKEFIKRFDREAKIAAKLSHNNIVNAIDAGEVNGYHYFVMEYVEGRTIKDELDKNKVFDEKDALEIVLAVAEALEARPPARPDPPRHQARERDPHQGRRRQARRPRPGPADRRREVGDVRGRHGHRHALLHQPRAGPRPGRRRHPRRHLQPRRHPLPHGHRPRPLRRRDPVRGDAQARRQERHASSPPTTSTPSSPAAWAWSSRR